MIETSEPFDALAKALPAAQKAFKRVAKDAANPHFGNKYASLSEITEATLPALNEAGITVLQPATVGGEGMVQVTTMLLHESGQWLRATHEVPISKRDAQGVGSALTYARRQALQALLTVAPAGEDDDAEGAVGRGAGRPPLPPAPPPQKPDLAERTARLDKRMTDAATLRDLTRVWDLAKDLRADLAETDPETSKALAARHEARHVALLQGEG
jgi:hypothetical protein